MAFDLLSRRAKRVVRFSHVLDCRGATLAHRKMLPYIKEWAGGEATALVPSMRKTTSFVRSNRFAAAIFNLSTGFFKQQQQTTFLLTGADPFDASVVFSASFERSSLPTDVGGSLTIGSDGHCCRGVSLPALNDADAVWSFYEGRLSPSLQAQVAARNNAVAAQNPPSSNKIESPHVMLESDEIETAREQHLSSSKSFAVFLSHHKEACAAEARLVKLQYEDLLGVKCFGTCSLTNARFHAAV